MAVESSQGRSLNRPWEGHEVSRLERLGVVAKSTFFYLKVIIVLPMPLSVPSSLPAGAHLLKLGWMSQFGIFPKL